MKPPCALYEFPLLRRITGDTLRPGGLDVTGRALELCCLPPQAAVLDMGCGGGASLGFLRGHGLQAVGMDISLPLLREAQARGPAVMADARRLPFAPAVFQAVFCECVISLLYDQDSVFTEVWRVLSPGGLFIVSDMVRLSNLSGLQGRSCLGGAKTREEMIRLFDSTGFALKHTLDLRNMLRELAAKMVWEFGSMNAFWALWKNACPDAATDTPCGKDLGYELFIGQKSGY